MATRAWRTSTVGRAGAYASKPSVLWSEGFVGNITTGEDTLTSNTVRAFSLRQYEVLHVRATGNTGTNANTKNLKLYWNNVLIGTTGALAANAKPWIIEADIVAGSTSAFICCMWGMANGAVILPQYALITADYRADIICKLTGEATATDDIVCYTMVGISMGIPGVS